MDALKERWAAYQASGRGAKPMTFDLDDQILASQEAATRSLEPAAAWSALAMKITLI